jgi:hypothetical protein
MTIRAELIVLTRKYLSFFILSCSQTLSADRNIKSLKRSAAEQRAIDEALHGIRMRVSYEDPFELWHKEASVKAKVGL